MLEMWMDWLATDQRRHDGLADTHTRDRHDRG